MTERAKTRTSDISARVLATLGVALGFAVISADAGAGLGGGLLVGTTCSSDPFGTPHFVTSGPNLPTPTGLAGSLTSLTALPCSPDISLGSGDVSFFVDYGVMKTIGHATGFGAVGSGQSSMHILFSDLVTFDPMNSSLIGQSATIQAQMQLQALLTGDAQWWLDVTFGGTTETFSSNDSLDSLGLARNCSSPCTFDLTLGMTLGTPTQLQVDLQAIDVGGPSSSFDLSQSVYWAGIQSVTVGGQPIAFTLTSPSEHDWTQSSVPGNGSTPAPEPESLALLAAALVGLGFARRQRDRANPALKTSSRRRRMPAL